MVNVPSAIIDACVLYSAPVRDLIYVVLRTPGRGSRRFLRGCASAEARSEEPTADDRAISRQVGGSRAATDGRSIANLRRI
jgi:hypothetical protein